jgi:hypothetical protein
MDYGEYWFLEIAIDGGIPFRFVDGSPRYLQEQWNLPWHELNRSQVLDVLERLQSAGDIAIRDEDNRPIGLSRDEMNEEIESRRRGPDVKMYWLTPQGGARWEQFTQANWDCYHSWDWDPDEDDVLEIGCISPDAVERAFQYVAPWNQYFRVIADSVSRRKDMPWQATYWKTIDVGYIIRFRCELFADYQSWFDSFYGGMPPEEIEAAAKHVATEAEFFRWWYTPHPGRLKRFSV